MSIIITKSHSALSVKKNTDNSENRTQHHKWKNRPEYIKERNRRTLQEKPVRVLRKINPSLREISEAINPCCEGFSQSWFYLKPMDESCGGKSPAYTIHRVIKSWKNRNTNLPNARARENGRRNIRVKPVNVKRATAQHYKWKNQS